MFHSKTNTVQRRALFGTVTAAALALALSGCGGTSVSSDASKENTTETIRIAQAPVYDFSPVWVAVEEGFFAKQGLEVELKESVGTGAESIAMINSGQVDMIAGSPSAMLSAASQGLDTEVVTGMSAFPANEKDDPAAIIVSSSSGIKDLKDLSGKTIGVTSLKSQQESKVAGSIDAAGGDSSTVEFVQVPAASMAGLVRSGELDAAQPFEPAITKEVGKGGVEVIGYANWQVLGGVPAMTLTSTGKWKAENPKKLAGVRTAIQEAVDFINDKANQDRYFDILAKYTESDKDILSQVRMDYFTTEVTAAGLQKLQENLLKYGVMESPVETQTLIGD